MEKENELPVDEIAGALECQLAYDTFATMILVDHVCAQYPHLRKSSTPHVQLAHLIFMLMDYLEKDDSQPAPKRCN
jgi:hypothetical protein